MLWLVLFLVFAWMVVTTYTLSRIEKLSIRARLPVAELNEEDRNLLRRVARLLEENTSAQRRGRP